MLSAHYLQRLHQLSRVAAGFVIGVGCLVLLGWWQGIGELYQINPQLPHVEPNSAIAFIFSGLALWLLQPRHISRRRRFAGQLFAVLGGLLGLFTLLEYAGFLPDGEINHLLVGVLPGQFYQLHMSAHAALVFLLTNVVLMLLSSDDENIMYVVEWSAFLGIMALMGVFLGYAYHSDWFKALFGREGMALHSATAFVVLGWGIVLARVEQGFFSILTADTAGGTLARRAVPLFAIAPLVLGWLPLWLAGASFSEQGVQSVVATTLVFILVTVIIRLAYRLHEQDLDYRQISEDVQQHQSELAHVARLNTVGELASGLAHELNQPLAAVSNYAAACQRMIQNGSGGEQLLEPLGSIQKQAQRASEIIRRLRAFVRKQQPHKARAKLERVIRDSLVLIEHQTHRMNVPVHFDIQANMPDVAVDSIQIEQVILNIVQNSLDAMLSAATVDRHIYIRAFTNAERALQVDIQDTGPGIKDELKPRVFDAFVTTKGIKGMGVGLALCRTIVEAHGGRLWVESQLGKGTTFSFTLQALAATK